MDVEYINPFLQGTLEVINTMASFKPVTGKPYVKTDDLAHGDVSGIIGITGDAVGSLAISFTEICICNIVGRMLGENFTTINHDVLDAVGEITNMISGVSRTQLEKKGMSVFAAIPSVVFGANHTINHILKSPSIVIPFSTQHGPFFVDVCIRTAKDGEKKAPSGLVVNIATLTTKEGNAPRDVSVKSPPAAHEPEPKPPPTAAPVTAVTPAPDVTPSGATDPGGRLELLKKRLAEIVAARNTMQKELAEKPFMEIARRKLYKANIPVMDTKIRRLKHDVAALEMLAKMTKEELENPPIIRHYQHYDPKEVKKR